MELQEAIRSLGTCRYYKPDPVPDEILARAFDAARMAPNGGNRQPVRFIVVRDPATKRRLKEWYLVPWKAYVQAARESTVRIGGAWRLVEAADYFAEHMDEIPVWVVVCASLADIHATDTELGRFSIVGGSSIYPAVQNFLLTCRELGLGTALTTLLCHYEPQVKELLSIPEGVATAATLTVGYPERPFPTRLSRRPVSELVSVERFDQPFTALPG